MTIINKVEAQLTNILVETFAGNAYTEECRIAVIKGLKQIWAIPELAIVIKGGAAHEDIHTESTG